MFARASGKASGQHIEIPMLDAAIYWLWPDVFMGHTLWGDEVEPGPLIYQIYRLQQTADGHLVYFYASDKEFAGLCKALGHPDWIEDERFLTAKDRMVPEHFEALGSLLHNAFIDFSTDVIMSRLHDYEVPAAQVNSVADVFTDPQVVNNEIIVEWEHPDAGLMKMARPPVRWGTTEPDIKWSADHVGQSTFEILEEYGFTKKEILELQDSKVIANE